MEDNKESIVRNKPKLDIRQHGNTGIYELNYSGSTMLITKDELGRLHNQLKLKDGQIAKLNEKNEALNSELDQAKKEIQKLKSELAESEKEKEKLDGKLESFTKYQGNGRPPVLSNEHKNVIKALHGKNMSVSDIHKALILKFGFKGNYETIRKYIRDSEKVGSWQ